MQTDQYWSKRMDVLNESQLSKGEDYIKKLNQEYDKAMASIQKDINVFYQRFAINNEVSLAEARQMLKAGELKEFKWSVEEYIKKGRENAVDQRWMKELENASIKVRMSRLEALQTQMRQQVEMLAASKQRGITDLLGDKIYKDNYYRSIFELQKGAGFGSSFAKLDSRFIDNMLATPWAPDGSNFSSRIWKDRTKLISELQTTLLQAFIRGDPSEVCIKQLSARMGVSKSDAERLVMTESAYFAGQSRMRAYRELGVEQYKYTSTLDKRTSSICRQMDGKVFAISEAHPGVNYPPLHARCRSTTIPFYEDNVKERAARDDVGITYDVPGDMTYKEWAGEHVEGAVEEPPSQNFNRKFNSKASYHIDLPNMPEPVAEKVAEINRSIARQGYKDGKEIMVIMDDAGQEIARAVGEINKVMFTQEVHEELLRARNNSVTLTHNHPRGTRINVKDARNFALYPSIAHMIAAGHDGGISRVSNLGKVIDLMMFNEVMARAAHTVDARLQSDKKYATMSSSLRDEYFDYLVLLEIVKELGWEYGEEFEKAKGKYRFDR